jgi:hypothetical protein
MSVAKKHLPDLDQQSYDDMIRQADALIRSIKEWTEQFYDTDKSAEAETCRDALNSSLTTCVRLLSAKAHNKHGDKV